MHIDDTVRWKGPRGQHLGWHYRAPLGRVWGLDNLGRFGRFSVCQKSGSHQTFVAPNGVTYGTMRELFARFRLRLSPCDRRTDQLELLRLALRLLAMEVHRTDLIGFVNRVFGGNRSFTEAYLHWLEVEQLISRSGVALVDCALTIEAHAVLRMLDLTAVGSAVDTTPSGAVARFDSLFPGQR